MNTLRKYAPEIAIGILLSVLWLWMLLALSAGTADAQEQRCSVQVFDPPLESGWAMPGDADTVEIMFTDGTGTTLVGPFVLGDLISHPGQVAMSIRKCTAVGVPSPPSPTPTVVPPTPEPEPESTPEPTPSVTPVPEDQCCTTVVTPGPEPTPTPIIPTPPVPPSTPEPTPTPAVATPTPAVPELPATGLDPWLGVLAGVVFLALGAVLSTVRRIR